MYGKMIAMKTSDLLDRQNFRDLGGIPVKDGRSVRHGLFFRSGEIHVLPAEGVAELRSLNIRSVLDFRDAGSQRRKADPDIGARLIPYDKRTARFGEHIDFSPVGFGKTGKAAEAQLESLYRYYVNMPYGYQALHAMFDAVKNDEVPILIHCSKGKDRTGVASMVLLLALGAEDDVILRDYMYSNISRKTQLDERIREGRSIHPEDEGYLTLMYLREGVKEEIGRMILDNIHATSGTAEQYMYEEYGWTEAELNAVRDRYLEQPGVEEE